MPEERAVRISVNGQELDVPAGCVVSAAMLRAGAACRVSVSGESRTAVCGMGICFECRAVVNGVPHQRTCQMICVDGMRVETQR